MVRQARQGSDRLGAAWSVKARHGLVWQARLGKARYGPDGLGAAGRGEAVRGPAWQAWIGLDRFVPARRGIVRLGVARQAKRKGGTDYGL